MKVLRNLLQKISSSLIGRFGTPGSTGIRYMPVDPIQDSSGSAATDDLRHRPNENEVRKKTTCSENQVIQNRL